MRAWTRLQSLGIQPLLFTFKSYKDFFHTVVGIQEFQSGLPPCGWGPLLRAQQIWRLGLHPLWAWLDIEDLIPKWCIPSQARQYCYWQEAPMLSPRVPFHKMAGELVTRWLTLPDGWSKQSQTGSHNVFHYLTSEVTHHHFHRKISPIHWVPLGGWPPQLANLEQHLFRKHFRSNYKCANNISKECMFQLSCPAKAWFYNHFYNHGFYNPDSQRGQGSSQNSQSNLVTEMDLESRC